MEKKLPSSPNRKNQRQRQFSAYAEYSGMAIQMMVVIGLCVFAGLKLDQRLDLAFPAFTVGLTLLGVILAMVMVIIKVMRPK